MKAFTISAAVALLAAFAQAAPAPVEIDARGSYVTLKFEGATPSAYYTRTVPVNERTFTIDDPLSVSHIKSSGGATCTIYGKDGSVTTVSGTQEVDVGPPQTQVSGVCKAS
ncbi:hypothetical protein MMC29_004740 [Sticta canariensis]|nr:hypothetical protein [Sticta canariensis]